jgi:hypothetical protein
MPDAQMSGRFYLVTMRYEEKDDPNVLLVDAACDDRSLTLYSLDAAEDAYPARDLFGEPGRCTPAQAQPEFCLGARRPRRQLISFEDRKIALREAIACDAPPSVAGLNTALGLSPKTLTRQFPDLSQQLSCKHAKHRKMLSDERGKKADTEFRSAVAVLIQSGTPVTKRNVERALGKPMPPWSPYRALYLRFRTDADF